MKDYYADFIRFITFLKKKNLIWRYEKKNIKNFINKNKSKKVFIFWFEKALFLKIFNQQYFYLTKYWYLYLTKYWYLYLTKYWYFYLTKYWYFYLTKYWYLHLEEFVIDEMTHNIFAVFVVVFWCQYMHEPYPVHICWRCQDLLGTVGC